MKINKPNCVNHVQRLHKVIKAMVPFVCYLSLKGNLQTSTRLFGKLHKGFATRRRRHADEGSYFLVCDVRPPWELHALGTPLGRENNGFACIFYSMLSFMNTAQEEPAVSYRWRLQENYRSFRGIFYRIYWEMSAWNVTCWV